MATGLEGKVAFITGGARGRGRAHVQRLAGLGVHIIGVDICADLPGADYFNATLADLQQTAAIVEAVGAKFVTAIADVADQAALKVVLDGGLALFERLGSVIANAGLVGASTPPRNAESSGSYRFWPTIWPSTTFVSTRSIPLAS